MSRASRSRPRPRDWRATTSKRRPSWPRREFPRRSSHRRRIAPAWRRWRATTPAGPAPLQRHRGWLPGARRPHMGERRGLGVVAAQRQPLQPGTYLPGAGVMVRRCRGRTTGARARGTAAVRRREIATRSQEPSHGTRGRRGQAARPPSPAPRGDRPAWRADSSISSEIRLRRRSPASKDWLSRSSREPPQLPAGHHRAGSRRSRPPVDVPAGPPPTMQTSHSTGPRNSPRRASTSTQASASRSMHRPCSDGPGSMPSHADTVGAKSTMPWPSTRRLRAIPGPVATNQPRPS